MSLLMCLQLAMEKEESEREKWEIIKRARESAERAVLLRAQLDAREQTIKELQDEVAKVKDGPLCHVTHRLSLSCTVHYIFCI